MDSYIADDTSMLHLKTDGAFKKYKSFFRPAKYLVPVAIFALLMGSCDPESVPPGTEPPTDDPPTEDPPAEDPPDPSTYLDIPSFNAPLTLSITGLSVSNYYIFAPALADVDNDGDLDLFVGFNNISTSMSYYIQSIKFLRNNTIAGTAPSFTLETETYTGLPTRDYWAGENLENFHGGMMVTAGNIDDDGDVDIVSSNNLYTNTEGGYKDIAEFLIATNYSSSFNVSGPYYYSKHTAQALADIDDDGDLDLIIGAANTYSSFTSARGIYSYNSYSHSRVFYQINDGYGNFSDPPGGPGAPLLVAPSPISDITDFPIPALADVDNDGDQDLFTVTYSSGAVTFYLNTGTAEDPVFTVQASAFSVLPSDGVTYIPAFGDMDGDTDLDVIAGTNDGRLLYIENTDIDL